MCVQACVVVHRHVSTYMDHDIKYIFFCKSQWRVWKTLLYSLSRDLNIILHVMRREWNFETTYIHTMKEWAAQKQKLDPPIHSNFFSKIRFVYLESWKSDSRSWCILHLGRPFGGSSSHPHLSCLELPWANYKEVAPLSSFQLL